MSTDKMCHLKFVAQFTLIWLVHLTESVTANFEVCILVVQFFPNQQYIDR